MHKNQFGIIGLGVMGRSLALNLASKGFRISVYNRIAEGEETLLEDFMNSHKFENINGFNDLKEFSRSLEQPRSILIMIKAGDPVDAIGYELQPLLTEGDILIDGGNSFYKDTIKRNKEWSLRGVHFMGCGISGGEEGALNGPSMMIGGSGSAYRRFEGFVQQMAAKDREGLACAQRVGPIGAGHFVKMVHNGIEYAEMQLLAEVFSLLRPHYSYEEIANILLAWDQTDLSGYLLQITIKILRKKDGGDYILDKILDSAASKGTGAWSSIAALELGSPATMMSTAVHARYLSMFKTQREEISEQFGEKSLAPEKPDPDILKEAYGFARIINHIQGFHLIRSASDHYDWDISLSELARVWTNGCIIKSDLMLRLSKLLRSGENKLRLPELLNELKKLESSAKQCLHQGLRSNTSLLCISNSYNFWLAMNTAESPASLIQAQRDFFGAHGIEFKDGASGELHHLNWKE